MMNDSPESEPELGQALREQEAQLSAIRSRSEQAPPRLRAWLLRELEQRRPQTRRRVALGAALAATAVLAIALVVAIPGGGQKVGVSDAAVAGTRPATEPAPHRSSQNSYLLSRSIEGVPFPNWRERGWRTVGARSDRIDGRRAETVFYERAGRRVAYTIVSGSPLPLSGKRRSTVRAHVGLVSLDFEGRPLVTWRREGHTCVLSGSGAARDELLSLASWKAGGKIPY
jgi:hypothetical protein